jgi:serine/threonine protein kinase
VLRINSVISVLPKIRLEIKLEALGKIYTLYSEDEQECEEWFNELCNFGVQTNFKKQFQISGVLGKGSFGVVYNAFNVKKFKRVAIKSIDKQMILKNAIHSVRLMLTLIERIAG